MKTKAKIVSALIIILASINQVAWSQIDWNQNGNTGGSGYILGTTTGNFDLDIKNGAAYPINFWTNGSKYMTILGSTNPGFIGIGTAAPTARLTIWDNTSDESQMIRIGASSGSDFRIFRQRTDGILRFDGTQTTYSSFLFSTTAATNALSILNSGNVGIGLAAPAYKLDVSGGDINIGSTTTITNGYRLGTNMFLWHNGNTTDLFAGVGAGANNTASNNVFIGNKAGNANLSCPDITAIGYHALQSFNSSNSVGQGMTAVGSGALGSLTGSSTSGQQMTAIGYVALGTCNSLASENTAVGWQCLLGNTSGSNNSGVGDDAMLYNTEGSRNTAMGGEALEGNLTGNDNCGFGYHAGSGTVNNSHSRNSSFGSYSGYTVTTGNDNVNIGYKAGYSNTTGSNITSIGVNAGYNNTIDGNVFVGKDAGYNNTSGGSIDYPNVFVGTESGKTNTTGSNCTFVGYRSGYNSNANNNTFLGLRAGFSTTGTPGTNGGANCFIGDFSGVTNTTGQFNTCIGSSADIAAACSTLTNMTALGSGAVVSAAHGANTMQMGNSSVSAVWTQTAFNTVSDRRIKNTINENVPGLAFINLLKPVTYYYDIHKENAILGYRMKRDSSGKSTNQPDTSMWEGKYDIEKVLYTGFIAQQVDSAAQQIKYDFSGVAKPKDGTGLYGLSYAQFVVPLVKAVQELSKTIDSLKSVKVSQSPMQNNQKSNTDTLHVNLTLPDAPTLGDVQPNPNDGQATIPYYLPEGTSSAEIIFTDMLGRVMKEQKLNGGYGVIDINTQELPSGIYYYTLSINQKVVATKKMIRSK